MPQASSVTRANQNQGGKCIAPVFHSTRWAGSVNQRIPSEGQRRWLLRVYLRTLGRPVLQREDNNRRNGKSETKYLEPS
jgi:hypothetical protein